jgi:hypothetical protein
LCLAGTIVRRVRANAGRPQERQSPRKATTQSPVLDHLEPGDELTRVSDAKQNRFWNVESADGTRSWIYDTLVHFDDEEEE